MHLVGCVDDSISKIVNKIKSKQTYKLHLRHVNTAIKDTDFIAGFQKVKLLAGLNEQGSPVKVPHVVQHLYHLHKLTQR